MVVSIVLARPQRTHKDLGGCQSTFRARGAVEDWYVMFKLNLELHIARKAQIFYRGAGGPSVDFLVDYFEPSLPGTRNPYYY